MEVFAEQIEDCPDGFEFEGFEPGEISPEDYEGFQLELPLK